MAEPFLHGDTFWLDSFALRQWDDPNYSGTRISYDKAAFVQQVHEMFKADGGKLVRLSVAWSVSQCVPVSVLEHMTKASIAMTTHTQHTGVCVSWSARQAHQSVRQAVSQPTS
jgi:hypothetical protein